MNKYVFFLLLFIPLGYAALTCSFETSTTCSSGTKLLGVENDTGGLTNAHAQTYDYSGTTYANSLCCSTNLTDTLGNSCSGEVFAKLSSTDNAHVQANNYSTYGTDACISYDSTPIDCTARTSCESNETCLMSISDYDNAHVGECGDYSVQICCSESNAPPTTPTLTLPADNNNSVFQRSPVFEWTASTDPQGDAITYQLNISAPAACSEISIIETSATQITSPYELCVDETYNWTVRACDTADLCSAWAAEFNFSIASVVGISFSTNSTNFGELAPSIGSTTTDDTLDNTPAPLEINNTGNVRVNISVQGLSDLWEQQPLGTAYFQYADQNSASWNNVETSYTSFTSDLNYSETRELELRVEVPQAEEPGSKTTTIQAQAVSNE